MEIILKIVHIEQIICEAEEGLNYMIKGLQDETLLLDLLDVMIEKYSLLCV